MPETQSEPLHFADLGVAAPAQESRGVQATRDAHENYLVLASSLDWLLVTDVDTQETTQFQMPDGVPASAPYASIVASNGRFYTAYGKTFMEFDPTQRQWTFHAVPEDGDDCYLSFTESPDGRIWAGGCYGCHLISFDPSTRELIQHGQMDPQEQYPSFVAADASGWVYIGIGTARHNIIAYQPETGIRRQLVNEDSRAHGTASVRMGVDGRVYAAINAPDSGNADKKGQKNFFRCFQGKIEPVSEADVPDYANIGNISWANTKATLPDGRMVTTYSMPDHYMIIHDPSTGEERRIEFDYVTNGAGITSLAAGPDGNIYGSSCHPMHYFVHDPSAKTTIDFGGVPAIGGGNFCAITTQRGYMIGAEYAGGRLWLCDRDKPWAPQAEGDSANPRMLAQWAADICRPRTALAHPDGVHVLMAGFAGYGLCGGGIGIYNLDTAEAALLTAEKDLLPSHSCITLKALPSGDLIGGTCINAPGGGHTAATEAELFIIDWATRKLVFHSVPVPGDNAIISLEIAPDGLVYGLSNNGTLFAFDPTSREMIHSAPTPDCGFVPRHSLQLTPAGRLFMLRSKAICEVIPGTFEVRKLADTPHDITAGGAYIDGVLYYAADTHLCSCIVDTI